MLKIRLVVTNGSNAGARVRVEGDSFTVGRSTSADLRLVTNTVSRQHCRILRDEERVMIQDLGSRNGTEVNGRLLTEGQACRLWHHDKLKIGKRTFRISIRDAETKRPLRGGPSGSGIARLSNLPKSPPAAEAGSGSSREPVSSIEVDAAKILDELDAIAGAPAMSDDGDDEPSSVVGHGASDDTVPSVGDVLGELDTMLQQAEVPGKEKTREHSAIDPDEDFTDNPTEALSSLDQPADPDERRAPGRLPDHLRPKGPVDSQDAANQALRRLFSGGE